MHDDQQLLMRLGRHMLLHVAHDGLDLTGVAEGAPALRLGAVGQLVAWTAEEPPSAAGDSVGHVGARAPRAHLREAAQAREAQQLVCVPS